MTNADAFAATPEPDLFKLVAEPNRRRILMMTWHRPRSAGEIAEGLPVTFGAVSQHLRLLHEAGLLAREKQGKHRYYRAVRERLGPLRDYLEQYWLGQLEELALLAEREMKAKKGEE